MAKVLLLSLVFRPDNVSTAQIMGDLALDLKALGHEIAVLTTVPHYNHDAEATRRQPLRRVPPGLFRRSTYEGIPVTHAFIPQKGANKLHRMAGWTGFHALSLVAGLFGGFRPELILTPSPPLTIGVCAWLLGRRFGCPFLYNVQEVYPDLAIDLGELRNRALIRFFLGLERFVYRKAAALTVISRGMLRRLQEKGVPPEKLHLIPNFVDTTEFAPGTKDNAFARRHELRDRFVVLYAGNMGKPQGLNVLLDAAARLQDTPHIRLVLMGTGSERAALENQARHLGLRNVLFLGQQPYATMGEVHATADLCFVSQAPGTTRDGIPSKVFRIMSTSRPVLAATEPDSDLARVVSEAGAGVVVEPGQPDALAREIHRAFAQPELRETWGSRGRAHVIAHFSRPRISGEYDRLIRALARPGPVTPRAPTHALP